MTPEQPVIDNSEHKRIILTKRMAFLVSGVTLLYLILAFVLEAEIQPILFISMLSCATAILALIYVHRYELAKAIGLFFFLMIIYAASGSESLDTGLHLHFITGCVVAIALYGYHQWRWALTFIFFAFFLYLLMYFYRFPWIEMRDFSPAAIRIFFVINLSTCLIVSAYSIFLLSKLNHISELELGKKKELLNRQNDILSKTNTELDRFVYSASHDLRAPLSSILGLVNLAEMSTDKKEIDQYLAFIRGRINTLDLFIYNIIDYSRNARQEILQEQIELASLVESVIDGLKYSPDARDIKFEVVIDKDTKIESDSSRINIILNNLVSNAIKYRKHGQKARVTIHWQPEFRHLIVADNGIGIEPVHHEKIFTMFFRASQKSNGSGLGLYIANEAAVKIGAKISLRSEINKGSEFIVHLPPCSSAMQHIPQGM